MRGAIFFSGKYGSTEQYAKWISEITYLINNQPTPQFIIGDAELNRWTVENGIKVNTDYGKRGKKDVYKSSGMIQKFLNQYPNIEVQ